MANRKTGNARYGDFLKSIPKLANLRKGIGPTTENDVLIDRTSKWGNPFYVDQHGSRIEVIQMYEEYILGQKVLLRQLPELLNKTLWCWCTPNPCHGDVLIKLVKKRVLGIK